MPKIPPYAHRTRYLRQPNPRSNRPREFRAIHYASRQSDRCGYGVGEATRGGLGGYVVGYVWSADTIRIVSMKEIDHAIQCYRREPRDRAQLGHNG